MFIIQIPHGGVYFTFGSLDHQYQKAAEGLTHKKLGYI